MGFDDQFEFLLVTSLEFGKSDIDYSEGRITTDLIRVMFQTLPPVSLLNVGLGAIPRHTENLVIVLGLAPLEGCLCFLQLAL